MILYKYVGFEAGLKILETNTLGFSHLEDFNDPFEATALALVEDNVPISVQTGAIRNRLSRKYAILSLTRAPLNPLMWSHYADSYKGMVIGIDTKLAGLDDAKNFLIPSNRGEVIYLNTPPRQSHNIDADTLMSIGDCSIFNWNNFEEFLKHAFLYKSLCWSYEEEVRIVKNISAAPFGYHFSTITEALIDNQYWKRVQLPTRPIYTLQLPKEAFVEVYLGKNTYIDQCRKQEKTKPIIDHKVERIEQLKMICQLRQIPLKGVSVNLETWALQSRIISSD
ncbi:DUF2971 domain-containing protein [Acinetobacter sp. DSM 11652]|uniref:DUF2971 domain-containing protein n=1 Tax=Acinetobacter sp. DSM 11652 TaxID=346222 RepID=UPI0008C4EBFB|nr:DUF2971 domain-containing protein [Acinetobacter sp. DSM 11652]SEM02934.1 Protein of unknown function [Acinetobacter sp. DSM 11652]